MPAERYAFNLSDAVRQFCVENLDEPEDDEEIHKKIDEMKLCFAERCPSMALLRDDDVFLIRFLRSCKYDLDQSLRTLRCYHKLRYEWEDIFELVGAISYYEIDNKERLENAVKKGDVSNLEGRAKDRSFILLKRPGSSGESVKCFVASVFASYEKLLEDEESQIYGFTVIADMSHLNLWFAIRMALLRSRIVKMLQEVLPIRIQHVNVVNEGFAFSRVFRVACQLMKRSLREKIKLHSSNHNGLQEFIEEDVLPHSLAGTGPPVNSERWWNLISSEQGPN